jgi:hypothetical protein
MSLTIVKTSLQNILPLRQLYLQEMACQIRYEAVHHRGWSDSYAIALDGKNIGYGSIKGLNNLHDRDTVFEFYLLPSHRQFLSPAFARLVQFTGANAVECQTNDQLFTSLLFEFTENINADAILFREDETCELAGNGAIFRPRKEVDKLFLHSSEPEGEYVLDLEGVVIATGGFTTYYNKSFADIYMELAEAPIAGRVMTACWWRNYRKNAAGRDTRRRPGATSKTRLRRPHC